MIKLFTTYFASWSNLFLLLDNVKVCDANWTVSAVWESSKTISTRLIASADTLSLHTNGQDRASHIQKHDILMKILTLQDMGFPGVSLMTTQTKKDFLKDSVFHPSCVSWQPIPALTSDKAAKLPTAGTVLTASEPVHSCSWHLAGIKWQMTTISTSYIEHLKERHMSVYCALNLAKHKRLWGSHTFPRTCI